MTVKVTIEMEGIMINEAFAGASAEEVVGKMKARAVKEMNFAMRLAINAMSNLMFAQEVVKRYNSHKKLSLPVPGTCQDFISLAAEHGFAEITP